MSDAPDPQEMELSNKELIELLKKHGIGRRGALAIVGGSVAAGALGGIATGSASDGVELAVGNDTEPEPDLIDPQFGFSVSSPANTPDDITPDHVVELHILPPSQDPLHPPLFHFSPTGLCVEPGDVVQFTFTTPDHTVTAYHNAMGFQQRVPPGTPPFSSPIVNAGGAWFYRFDNEGLYDYYCGAHHILGMAGRIFAGDPAEVGVPEYEDKFEGAEGPPPLLAPFSKDMLETELNHFSDSNSECEWPWLTPQEVLDTDALDPSNICDGDGMVSFEEVLDDIDRISAAHDHSG